MSRDRPQSLAQLQAELRNWSPMTNTYNNPKYEAAIKLADALQPHVEREAAAQAKSLADERRIASLEAELIAERTRRLAAEKVVDHAIAHASYAGTRVMAQEYRTQYPRVEEEK